jgi:hypothetical protein
MGATAPLAHKRMWQRTSPLVCAIRKPHSPTRGAFGFLRRSKEPDLFWLKPVPIDDLRVMSCEKY